MARLAHDPKWPDGTDAGAAGLPIPPLWFFGPPHAKGVRMNDRTLTFCWWRSFP
jgi:hypothetical protein